MIVRPVLDDPTRRIVFMGFSDDLQAELERVLAGLPTDTHWARIELPTAMLEQAKGIYRCHDLARTEDVQLFQRSDEGIYEMDSGAEQFEWGTLLLVGPGYLESTGCSPWAIDEEGQPWTISFDYSWHGPVLRDDGERESMGVTGSFGGAATHVCMGGGLCPHEM